MTFEVFQRPRAAQGPLLVTVQSNGALRINAAAQLAIHQPTHVHLLVDLDAGRFAIKPATVAGETTFRVVTAGTVSAAAFVRYACLAPGRYPAEFDGNMLVMSCG